MFGDTASITLQAVPFGNYFPAGILITWTGWINPVGTKYVEFRGGIVLWANGRNSADNGDLKAADPSLMGKASAYMWKWSRDGEPESRVRWVPDSGFDLQV